jgi:O-methyltransferase involved in polyketide biosynthesis
MNLVHLTRKELAAAFSSGVRQCVLIGSIPLYEAVEASAASGVRVIALDELATGTLAEALEKAGFDRRKAGFFVWLGGAGCRTVDAMVSSLAFIASLPKGSGVVLDYLEEQTSIGVRKQTALDALASRLQTAGGNVKYLIQPQAVTALLRGVGFRQIADVIHDGMTATGGRLVSALV